MAIKKKTKGALNKAVQAGVAVRKASSATRTASRSGGKSSPLAEMNRDALGETKRALQKATGRAVPAAGMKAKAAKKESAHSL